MMPRSNIDFFPCLWPIMTLMIMISLLIVTVSVHAAPPVSEIYTIMSEKALRLPSHGSLAALNDKHLETSLLAIDPYARYVPPISPLKNSSLSVQIGIEIFVHKSQLWIQPVLGGPSDRVGLPEIGILLAINGRKVQGYNLDRISVLLDKAVQKSLVILTVSSNLSSKGKDYRIMPATYQSPSITWQRIGDDIVMRIIEFITHYTAIGLSARFTTLVSPKTQVVLDLRGCSGGDLYEAIEIAGLFVPSGLPLASTYDRNGIVKIYQSPLGQKLKSPNLVLIDDRTASAAEILAGILQYHHLASVVGEQSYGKCLSQTLFPLSDGGGLWLTTLDVRFPDKRSCTGSGVKPDIPYSDISITKINDIIRNISKGVLVPH